MNFSELLEWQWRDYAERHRNRTNLLIHIIAVPLLWLGTLNFLSALLFSGLLHALGGAILVGLSLFAQGKGHELEKIPPEHFNGGADFARRIVAEQFVTFPRFVFSGGWWKNLNASR